MKTGIITTKTIASEGLEKSIMGMSQRGMEMATYFLRDRIYSDKEMAFIREYISNAWDEHVKHEISENVEVRLEKKGNQWIWSVRDYALGLSEHDIRNVFAMYFESTKANENQSIGGFGVGGKAGFSYSDTFYVTSHHNGVKTMYVCTLGAGTKGIPVGECYRISQEPTTQQGIEISLDVTKDYYSVAGKTKKFVTSFFAGANIVYYNNVINATFRPHDPAIVKIIGEYVINGYKDFCYDTTYNTPYLVRMGGVVYPYPMQKTRNSRNFSHTVVVDVPIGKLTLPITRESIEDLPTNAEVFSEIEKCLDLIEEEEKANFQTPKFGSIISTPYPDNFGSSYHGQWFTYEYGSVFPKTKRWRAWFNRGLEMNSVINSSTTVSPTNGKYTVFLFPDIKNIKTWHYRLQSSLKATNPNYSGYVWTSKSTYDKIMKDLDSTIDISDCVFVDIKKLKLPKYEKISDPSKDVEYLVYDSYGYKKFYTPNTLNDLVTQKHFNGVEPDDDWYENATDRADLWKRTIGNVKEHGTRAHFRTVNSKKMIESMKELGWITPEMPEYIKKIEEINQRDTIERTKERILSKAEELFFGISCAVKTKEILVNSPGKISRLENKVKAIIQESSSRGRILKTIKPYYDHFFTRNDLRKILRLKD